MKEDKKLQASIDYLDKQTERNQRNADKVFWINFFRKEAKQQLAAKKEAYEERVRIFLGDQDWVTVDAEARCGNSQTC